MHTTSDSAPREVAPSRGSGGSSGIARLGSLVSWLRGLSLISVAVAGAACADASETPVSRAVVVERPPWFRAAVAESARTLQWVGCERAPLDIVDTSDSLWLACLSETVDAAESARRRVYLDALGECVEWRGIEPECCFARTSDPAAIESAKAQCEAECRRKRVVGRSYRIAPKCSTEVVAYSLDVMRFRTGRVDALLADCAVGVVGEGACEALPTRVERLYCRGACAAERDLFVRSLGQCKEAVRQGGVVSCEHLFADKSVASPGSERRRKEGCEAECYRAEPAGRR